MYRPKELGSLLTRICRDRGLSAAAASRAAGLSVNQVRNVQRGRHRPRPEVLSAIAEALSLGDGEASELRRLAGIEPDPAATPESKAARRDAWPLLTYALVNHFLLPSGKLSERLESASSDAAAMMRRAAEAVDVQAFYCDVATEKRPRGLVRSLESTFHDVTAETAMLGHAQLSQFASVMHGAQTIPHPESYSHDRSLLPVLLSFRDPGLSESDAMSYIDGMIVDHRLAVLAFPQAFYQACLTWRFEKLSMRLRYARHGEPVQRKLYDRVRRGLSLHELDDLLVNPGRLTTGITPARPRHTALTHARRGLRFEIPTWPVPLSPELDSVFDSLDRAAFLDQFPLLKIAPSRFASHVRTDLRSWRLLCDRSISQGATAEQAEAALLTDAFQPPLTSVPLQRPASLVHRLVADEIRRHVESLAHHNAWDRIMEGAKSLDSSPGFVELLQSVASSAPPLHPAYAESRKDIGLDPASSAGNPTQPTDQTGQ